MYVSLVKLFSSLCCRKIPFLLQMKFSAPGKFSLLDLFLYTCVWTKQPYCTYWKTKTKNRTNMLSTTFAKRLGCADLFNLYLTCFNNTVSPSLWSPFIAGAERSCVVRSDQIWEKQNKFERHKKCISRSRCLRNEMILFIIYCVLPREPLLVINSLRRF